MSNTNNQGYEVCDQCERECCEVYLKQSTVYDEIPLYVCSFCYGDTEDYDDYDMDLSDGFIYIEDIEEETDLNI